MALNKEDLLAYFKVNNPEFLATHNRLCIPIINRIYKKMKRGIRFDDIKVCDGLIIDGHHRYVSSLLADRSIGTVVSSKTSATTLHNWIDIDFVEEKWDTADKIYYLNELDALHNGISLEEIIDMTK